MGTIVAGVDFGTLNVRVSIFDSEKGRLGAGIAEYPLHRKKGDPDHATQSHADHMQALVAATRRALADANVDGKKIAAIALDTTGSSVVPVGENLVPLDDYYLWCDHRAWREAAEITQKAHEYGTAGYRMVRRSLFVRVGLLEAAALAAAQSREARSPCFGVRALRFGGGRALRHQRPGAGAAQHLRHGAQMALERIAGRIAAGRVSGQSRSAAQGHSGKARKDGTRRPIKLPATCRRNGRSNLGYPPGFRFRSAHSMLTGTRLARVWRWAMWST